METASPPVVLFPSPACGTAREKEERRTPERGLIAIDLVRYGACSAAALGLDYGLLLALTYGFGVHYLLASAIGFLSGLVLAYRLSIDFVFKGRRSLPAPKEFAGFAAIGVAGLALTQVLLAGFVGGLGLSVALAKPVTALAVFIFNFGMRRSMLFASGAAVRGGQPRP
jgi:putative flippase GtrA